MFATKINKNPELFFVFVHRNATRCIGGQNKILIKFVHLRRMSSVGRVSIIMLQKVAANVCFVAADLRFMACEVR